MISELAKISGNVPYVTPCSISIVPGWLSYAITLDPKPFIIEAKEVPILPVPITPTVLPDNSKPVSLSMEKLPSRTLLYALCVFLLSVRISATACSATATGE